MQKEIKLDIILAEDNEEDAYLALRAFDQSKLPYTIHHVKDGEELMDYLLCRNNYKNRVKNHMTPIILLDINMPKMNGFDCLKEMHDEKLDEIPVVVFTTSLSQSDVKKCHRLGASAFMTKPSGLPGYRQMAVDFINFWGKTAVLPCNGY